MYSSIFNKKVVIFDLDGTLVNSAETVISIINKIRLKLNLEKLKINDKTHDYIGIGGLKMISYLIPEKENHNDLLFEFRNEYLNWDLKEEEIFSGVKFFLKKLKQNGVKVSVLTNKPKVLTIKTLKSHKIFDLIDYNVTADDVEKKKPNTEGLNKILDYFNVSVNDIVYFGDTLIDKQICQENNINFFMKLNNNLDFNFYKKKCDQAFFYTEFNNYLSLIDKYE